MTENAPPAGKTVLYDLHVSLGARMVPFAGYLMPIQYEGILAEHAACRSAAALFDTCHMGELRVTGPGCVPDLERLLTCPVASLAAGQCRYGLMCSPDGGVLDDLLVYRLGPEHFMLVVNAATRAGDVDWVRAHASDNTRVDDISAETAKLDLQGPRAPAILRRIAGPAIAGLEFYRFLTMARRDAALLISRTGYTGEIGFECYGAPDQIIRLWNDCLAEGAAPAGLGARDTLRLEMGMPLYGQDLSADRNAGESGFTRAIAPDKDFIGAGIVRDERRLSHRFRGIELADRRAARHGAALTDAAGQPAGIVTSGSFAPSLGRAVALGYVRKDAATPGTELTCRGRREALPGRIASLPFYRQGTARLPMSRFL